MSAVQATAIMNQGSSSTNKFIRRFTLRRMVFGAVLFGLFAAVESIGQGLGIVAAYPNVAERAKIIYGLASNSALGLFYGDRHANIVSPAGYMVYRILPVLALVGAIWALMFMTKMLRGQEDSGRWELLLSGQTSAQKATAKTIMGAGGGVAIAYVMVTLVVMAAGHSNKLNISPSGALYYGLAVIAGAAIAVGVGAVTSQLAATKRRATLYGLIPLLAFFMLRSVGNVVDSLAWLKNLTPFGWVDKLHPFYNSQPIWFLPLGLLALAGPICAIWLSGKRDMAESFIADSASAKPKLKLLNSQFGFAFRETRNVLFGWLFASVAFATVIASIDKTVAKAFTSSGAISKTFGKLAGNPYASIELGYLGAASYILVTLLMVLVTNGMGATREEESSGRLDNFVSGTVGRSCWLSTRLVVLLLATAIITVISNLTVWGVARVQGVHVGFSTLIFGGLSILGPVVFLLGVGVLLFGLLPRIAVIAMFTLIGWSFTIDIVASALKTSKYLADTSLLHHISLVPAASPKWSTFGVLVGAGVAMMLLGILSFRSRDLEAE